MSGGNLEDVCSLSGMYLEGSGRCQEGAWKLSGGYLECVWKVPGKCLERDVTVSGSCLELM